KENAQNRGWYARNREARKEQIKQYEAANPEARKTRAIKYYKINRVRLYAANRARLAANPDRARSYWQKRYALEKNAVGSFYRCRPPRDIRRATRPLFLLQDRSQGAV